MLKLASMLALAATASATRNTDHYPYSGPCADNNDAAKSIFVDDGVYYNRGCKNYVGSCGQFPIGEGGYDLVGHLCPETCNTCEASGKPGTGVFRMGDNDDLLAAMSFPACADLADYCGVDATIRAMCGETCQKGCDSMGFRIGGVVYGQGNMAQQEEQVCMGAPHDMCPEMTYGEAEDMCESWGARMCHLDELEEAEFRDFGEWQDVFDKGDDYVKGNNGGELPGPDYGNDVADTDLEVIEAGDDETVILGETRLGGRPVSTCNAHKMQVWVHPQDASCHQGGGEGQLVAKIGNGSNVHCKAQGAKAAAVCCHVSGEQGVTKTTRKMLAHKKELAPLDWSKASVAVKAALAAQQ